MQSRIKIKIVYNLQRNLVLLCKLLKIDGGYSLNIDTERRIVYNVTIER